MSLKHEFTYDGTTVRIYEFNKNEGLPMHSHEYSHATFCCAGSCLVTQEDKEIVVDISTKPVNLVGGKLHQIMALEDNTVFVNIFAEGKY